MRDAQGAAIRACAAGRSGARPRAAAALQTNNQINAVIAKVSPYVPIKEVAAALSRWKHLTTLTQAQQETLLSKFVIEKARNQQLMIMVLLIIVSAVIIALIIYTLTMDKVRSIATLKFVGAPDRTIVGLIVQQALSMGLFGYFIGLALVLIFKPYFPRRLVLDPKASPSCSASPSWSASPPARSAFGWRSRWTRRKRWRRRDRAMAEPSTQPVVRVEHLSKHFGAGSARVDALSRHRYGGLSRPGGRADGPERLGQDHAAQLHRLHSRAERGPAHARRRGGL